jgi:hypothetical protein
MLSWLDCKWAEHPLIPSLDYEGFFLTPVLQLAAHIPSLTNCCVESTMRTAYEKGYKVYTLKDCVAATSVAAQDATLEFNFGMFSVPTTSEEVLNSMTTVAASG